MDINALYSDYNIRTAPEGDKHYRTGWIQTKCPFCSGNIGFHLGYNLNNNYFNCWRCGGHPVNKVLVKLLGVSYNENKQIIRKYKGKINRQRTEIKQITIKKETFKLPKNRNIMSSHFAINYMKKRGFTKKEIITLINDFGIKITDNICPFKAQNKTMELKYRILAPVHWQGDIVSWQTRDMRNKSNLKYITCPKNIEKIHHKHIFYSNREFNLKNIKEIILTEGIFDVWRLHLAGLDAMAGFGVELKTEQILLLKQIPRIILWLDPDKAGEKKANELFNRLVFFGCNVSKIKNNINKDPGDLTKEEIQQILQTNKEK